MASRRLTVGMMPFTPNMALQRTRRPSLRSGRSPLNAYPLGVRRLALVILALTLPLNCRRVPAVAEVKEPRTAPSPPAVVSAAEIYRVGGEVTAPVLLKKIQPQYRQSTVDPELGVLVLRAIVAKDGTVQNLKIEHGPFNSYARDAMAAIRQWEYRPAMRHGQPVAVELVITVHHFPTEPDA